MVVAYKNTSDLLACYEHLRDASAIKDIVIVDNSYYEVGSCLEYAGLGQLDERTHHVVASENLGYAAGNNLGIAYAEQFGADHILICNPDVLIDGVTLDSLLREMDERNLHLVSPRLLEKDTAGSFVELSNPGWDRFLGRGVIDVSSSRNSWRYIPTFYGACFLTTTCLVNEVGGLSEDFFLYGEEIDYTLRIMKSDYAWGISESTTVLHGRGSSISPGATKSVVSFFHAARSSVIVGRKYWPALVAVWIFARSTIGLSMALRGDRRESRAILSGLLAGWKAPIEVVR